MSTEQERRCKYGDPYCPCQDGDTCHYEGKDPMAPSAGAQGETQADCAAALSMARDWLGASARERASRRMQATPLIQSLADYATQQAEEIARLRAALETRDMQLAGCSTAAIQNTPTSVRERIQPGHPYYSAAYGDVCRAVDREMQHRDTVQALQAQLECMVAPEERDQWRREAQRLAVERAYVQGVFTDAGVEVGPDLGEAARAISDLLSEAQQRIETLTAERNNLQRQVEDFEDQVSALYREMSELEERS